MQKRGLFILITLMVLFCTTTVFADYILSTAVYESLDTFALDDKEYEVQISASSILLKSTINPSESYIISLGKDKEIGNYRVSFDSLASDIDDIHSNRQYFRATLTLTQLLPFIDANWQLTTNGSYVLDTYIFEVTFENKGNITAQNFEYIHNLPEGFVLERQSGSCSNLNGKISISTTIGVDQLLECEYTVHTNKSYVGHLLSPTYYWTDYRGRHQKSLNPILFTAQDLVDIVVTVTGDAQLDAKSNITLSLENNIDDSVVVESLRVFVPEYYQFVSATHRASITDNEEIRDVLGKFWLATLRYRLSADSSIVDNISVRAIRPGQVPIYYEYIYSYDGELIKSPIYAFDDTIAIPDDIIYVGLNETPSKIDPQNVFTPTITFVNNRSDTLTESEIQIHFKNLINETIHNVSAWFIINGDNYSLFQKKTVPRFTRLRADNLFYVMPPVTASKEITYTSAIAYTLYKKKYIMQNDSTITVKPVEAFDITRVFSPAGQQEVDRPFFVTVTAKTSRENRAENVTFVEHIPTNFILVGGVTNRTMSLIEDELETVYSYQLIPKYVDEDTKVTLTTEVDYQLQKGALALNYSQNETTELTIGEFDDLLSITPTFDSKVAQLGTILSPRVDVSNNGSTDLHNISLQVNTRYFDSAGQSRIFIPLLFPNETKTLYLSLRIIAPFRKDEVLVFNATYTTTNKVTVPINTSLQKLQYVDSNIPGPLFDITIQSVELTKQSSMNTNSTSKSIFHTNVTLTNWGNTSTYINITINGTRKSFFVSANSSVQLKYLTNTLLPVSEYISYYFLQQNFLSQIKTDYLVSKVPVMIIGNVTPTNVSSNSTTSKVKTGKGVSGTQIPAEVFQSKVDLSSTKIVILLIIALLVLVVTLLVFLRHKKITTGVVSKITSKFIHHTQQPVQKQTTAPTDELLKPKNLLDTPERTRERLAKLKPVQSLSMSRMKNMQERSEKLSKSPTTDPVSESRKKLDELKKRFLKSDFSKK